MHLPGQPGQPVLCQLIDLCCDSSAVGSLSLGMWRVQAHLGCRPQALVQQLGGEGPSSFIPGRSFHPASWPLCVHLIQEVRYCKRFAGMCWHPCTDILHSRMAVQALDVTSCNLHHLIDKHKQLACTAIWKSESSESTSSCHPSTFAKCPARALTLSFPLSPNAMQLSMNAPFQEHRI